MIRFLDDLSFSQAAVVPHLEACSVMYRFMLSNCVLPV